MFVQFTGFCIIYVFFIPLILTMMHLCIVQCTYWTPLVSPIKFCEHPGVHSLACLSSSASLFNWLCFCMFVIQGSKWTGTDRNAVPVRQMHRYHRSVLSIKLLSFNLYIVL